jgi:peptide/nickel transport system substrate-binding protein
MWTRRAILMAGAALAAACALPARRSEAAPDVLRVGLPHEPPGLDPTVTDDPATLAISYPNIFEGLTRIDATGAVQPSLARSWARSADGLVITFELASGVRFHDGTSFGASHVVFALERLLSAASRSPNRQLFAAIAEVRAVDPATITLRLKEADERLLFNLGRPDAAIVAPESAQNDAALPIGTGPFAFVEWNAGNRVLLARNEDYRETLPRLGAITFVFVPDATTALAALKAGDLDGYIDFPAAEALKDTDPGPGLRVVTGSGPDGRPHASVWNAALEGIPAPASAAGGVALAGLGWPGTTAPPPSPAGDDEDEE